MDLELRHLKLIVAVVEEGTVSKAGTRLHLTQSALSHQLRDAEAKLGTPLFLRVNKKMLLTAAGERLLDSAYRVFGDLERAQDDIRQMALSRQGVLRISTECYTCYHWLPALLKPFGHKHPRVDVKIVVEATRRPIEALMEGKIDLAVVSSPARDRRTYVKPLFQDELVVIMHPKHQLAAQSYVRAKDLAAEHLITYTVPNKDDSLFRKVLVPAGITPRQVSQVQLTEATVEMVKAGLGIGVMARWAVTPQIESGELRALPLTSKGFRRQWNAVMLRNKLAPPYLLDFVELLAGSPPNTARKVKKAAR
ncbi:MAG TPA: LysR family transcriptional regulator [Pyrinomonadaceae bacterium]|jgi:LysR family transcriptional regulator for metE and metH|nr:LysR family transcriptional regulator [Pyrinomonadaceae bacterium]